MKSSRFASVATAFFAASTVSFIVFWYLGSSGTDQCTKFLVAFALFSFCILFAFPKIPQNNQYHNFADRRLMVFMRSTEIPNFNDVFSNIAFVISGLLMLDSLNEGFISRALGFPAPDFLCEKELLLWVLFAFGQVLVGFGSAFYHWNPFNGSLVFDRLPMTLCFMTLYVILLDETVGNAKWLLPYLLFLGVGSVVHWFYFEDLRPYIWVQFFPLLSIPIQLMIFQSRYSHSEWLLLPLVLYLLAKVTEIYDSAIFSLTRCTVSGHTMKHLLAACGLVFLTKLISMRHLVEKPV